MTLKKYCGVSIYTELFSPLSLSAGTKNINIKNLHNSYF